MGNKKTELYTFVANGVECIDNSEASKEMEFENVGELIDAVKRRYEQDKKVYLATGSWPNIHFVYRDNVWDYYYYLQLMDKDINLDKYLDFDYDTTKWTRDDIIEIINRYGMGILFALSLYINVETDLSFDDWFIKYNEHFNIPTFIEPSFIICNTEAEREWKTQKALEYSFSSLGDYSVNNTKGK